MENDALESPTSSPPLVGLIWLLAGALLLVEYLFISFIFDAGAWMTVPGPLQALGHLGELATIGTIAVFGTLLLRGSAILQALRALHRPQSLGKRAGAAIGHVLSYPLLVFATWRIFAVPDPERVTVFGLAFWIASALLSVITLLLVLLPWQGLVALAPRVAPPLGQGLLAGAAAFGLGKLSSALWGPMGRVTLDSVRAVLEHVAHDVKVDYARLSIGAKDFVVVVAPVCSGFEGIGLILVFLGGYIALNRDDIKLPNALWLLPVAVVTVWVANVLRIVTLILIGAWVSPQIALGGFHSKAGWVFFCMISLGFVAWLRAAEVFRVQPVPAREGRGPSDASAAVHDDTRAVAAAYLLPELVLLATTLVTGLFVHDVDWLYGLRIVAALAAMWAFRARLRPLLVRPSWQGIAIGVLVFAVWYLLTEHQTPAGDRLHAQVMGLGQPLAAAWIALRVLGSVLVVPVTEELAFRGYLLRRVIDRDFDAVPFRKLTLPSLLVSSLAFGLLHGDWIAAALAGAAYAVAQRWHGRPLDAVAAHATTNALVALDVLLLGAWGQW